MRRALDVVNQAEEIPNIEELNEVGNNLLGKSFLILNILFIFPPAAGPSAVGQLPSLDRVRCPLLSDPQKVSCQDLPLRPQLGLHRSPKEAAGLPPALPLGECGAAATLGAGHLECQQDHQSAGKTPGGEQLLQRCSECQAGGVLLCGLGGGGGEAVAPGHPQDHRDREERARPEEYLQPAHGSGHRRGGLHLADMAVLVGGPSAMSLLFLVTNPPHPPSHLDRRYLRIKLSYFVVSVFSLLFVRA